jgi:beta-lactamase regulating signal transducer with metallopeptidase domain
VTTGIEWSGAVEWAVRACIGMAVLWATLRILASRLGRSWLAAATLLAGVLSLPWCWYSGGNSLVWKWASQIGNGADVESWARVVWVVGAGAMLVRRAMGMVRILAVCREESRGAAVDAWRQSWARVARSVGVEGRVKIRFVEGLRTPAIWMGRVPWLLLPMDAGRWSEAMRGRVCRHELDHVLGGDTWLHRGWLLLDVVQWWNPVWWGLRGRLALELEKLADASVIGGSLAEARDYCRELVDRVAEGVTGVPAWGGSGGLEERVEHLLEGKAMDARWIPALSWLVATVSVVSLAIILRGPTPVGPGPSLAFEADLRMSAVAFPE